MAPGFFALGSRLYIVKYLKPTLKLLVYLGPG